MSGIRLYKGTYVEEAEQVREFLAGQEIHYERWEEVKVQEVLSRQADLSEADKTELLHACAERIEDLAARHGYRNWDVVVMSAAYPELLRKFGSVHTHHEPEVRVVTGGSCSFIIRDVHGAGYFELDARPGDVVAIPAHRPHAFKLSAEGKAFLIRLFVGEIGSVAYPYDDPTFPGGEIEPRELSRNAAR